MVKHPDGSIYLEAGEAIPVWCPCGEIYQPELHSECSDCPRCGTLHLHYQEELAVRFLDEPE
jgi:hypothetical protein